MAVRTAFDRYRLAGFGSPREPGPDPEPEEGGYVTARGAEGETVYVVTRDGARVRYARR